MAFKRNHKRRHRRVCEQLGVNPSIARNRLVKDLLFKLAIEAGHTCYRCGGGLSKDIITIEHKVPWLDSENPVELYFDLGNVAFSHQSCNASNHRSPNQVYGSVQARKAAQWKRRVERKPYDPEKRRRRYEKYGT